MITQHFLPWYLMCADHSNAAHVAWSQGPHPTEEDESHSPHFHPLQVCSQTVLSSM